MTVLKTAEFNSASEQRKVHELWQTCGVRGAGGTRRGSRDPGSHLAPPAASRSGKSPRLLEPLRPPSGGSARAPRNPGSGKPKAGAPSLGPARAAGPRGGQGGGPGPAPPPRSLFRAVQQDPGEAAPAAAHGDQQRAVDDLLHPRGQPAAGPRLHAPRPAPPPAPPAAGSARA